MFLFFFSMTDRQTDGPLDYTLDAHWYRESSRKKNLSSVFNSNREIDVSSSWLLTNSGRTFQIIE